MGGLFSPKNTKSTSTYTPPSYITDALKGLVGNAQGVYGSQPSGPNALQTSAYNGLVNVNSIASPYINEAADLTRSGATPYTYTPYSGDAIAQYASPYTQSVVDATQKQFNLQNAQDQNTLRGNAASAHALGGDRVGVAQAQLAGQQATAQAPVIAGLYNQGFQNAQNEFNTQQQTGIAAANSNAYRQLYGAGELGSLGQELQGTTLAGTGAQLQAGQYQQSQPYFNLQQLAPFLFGSAGASGGTQTSTQPGPSLFSQLAGLGLSAYGLGAFGGGGGGGGFNRGGELKTFDDGGFLDDEDISPDDEYGGEGAITSPINPYNGLPSPTPQLQPATIAALAARNAPTPANPQGIERASVPLPSAEHDGLFGMDNKHSAALQAGLGILASRSPGTFGPIGEGGLAGLKAYEQQKAMRAQTAYRGAMSQAALQRAEALAEHYHNKDAQPVILKDAGTIRLMYPGQTDHDGKPLIVDTGIENPFAKAANTNALTAARRADIAVENAATTAAGTLQYIGTDPATQKPIFFNNRTGRQQIGDAPIGAKPSAAANAPGHAKPLTPNAAMAQARHDYDIIYPKSDNYTGGTRPAPSEGVMNWIKKRAKAYQEGVVLPPAAPITPPPTPHNTSPPPVTPKYVTGKVYQDASGHKAKWDGQKFVDLP